MFFAADFSGQPKFRKMSYTLKDNFCGVVKDLDVTLITENVYPAEIVRRDPESSANSDVVRILI